jgi:hypothetical protein
MKAMQPVGASGADMCWRRFVVVMSMALAWMAVAIWPATAHAMPYSVWACADGDGRLLPDGDWFEVRDGPVHQVRSTCGDPVAIPATHLLAMAYTGNGNAAGDTGIGWRIQAAPGTRIAGLHVWWSGGTPSYSPVPGRIEVLAPSSIFRVDGPTGDIGAHFGIEALNPATAGTAFSETNHSAFTNLSTPSVTLKAWCVSACQGLPGVGGDTFTKSVADFEAYRLKTVVEDATPPQGSASGLDDGARIAALTRVQVDVTDVGGGVREVALRVDGRVADRVGTEGDCGDIDVSNSDPLEYARMQPCPSQRSVSLALAPTDVADGARHVVSVVATDAAGQETVITTAQVGLAAPMGYFVGSGFVNPDLNVVVPRRLNGTHGGAGHVELSFVMEGGRSTRLIGGRVVGASAAPRISGRLTSVLGAPISGARLWRASAVSKGNWQISGAPLTTSATGRVRGRLPAHSPSRDVRLVYFPYSDSSENVTSVSRRLEVRASTTIRLDKARYRNGDTVSFSGRITAKPIVPRKSVYLQVVVRGRWRTFDTTRADSEGRWSLRYRFTATRRPTAYRFRAVIPVEQSFPWATGRSPAVRVLVTP